MTNLTVEKNLNLMTACGDVRVEITDPRLDITPEPIGSRHHPMPHRVLIDSVMDTLNGSDYDVVQSVHALSGANGERYFGMAEVRGKNAAGDFSTIMGFRAAHDQKYAVGLVGGSGVFVCSNLCFFGEVKLQRKHTAGMIGDLPNLVRDAVARLSVASSNQVTDFANMKQAKLKESWADSLMTKMVREGVIAPSTLGHVIAEYDKPSHDEFIEDGHNVWTLFNAVTETYKPRAEGLSLIHI